MDIKKKSWIEEKRKNWPEDSKRQALTRDFPGCRSAFEAVQKVLSEKHPQQEQTALQTPRKTIPTKPANEDYLLMRGVVQEVEQLLATINFSKIPDKTRFEIAKMPITSAAEALDWKAAWQKAIGELDGGNKTNR